MNLVDWNPAFVLFLNGGTGLQAGRYFVEHCGAGMPFPLVQIALDTDPSSRSEFCPRIDADEYIPLPLTEELFDMVIPNAGRFGPAMETFVGKYPEWLDGHSAGQGSRAVPPLTEVAFRLHRLKVIRAVRNALMKLNEIDGWDYVVPIFIGSTGGGCGGTLNRLLAWALSNRRLRDMIMQQLHFGLLKPIAFAPDPFAQADQADPDLARWIKANMMGYRIDIDRWHEHFLYTWHYGMTNRAGLVLDQPDKIARVLALNVYQFIIHWPTLRAKFVNVDAFLKRPYKGLDTPERMLPAPTEPSNGKHVTVGN